MTRIKKLQIVAAALIAGSPVIAMAAPYTLTLTGVGDKASNGSVYYSPYTGTITNNVTGTQIYSGYLICDDYLDESHVGTSWGATGTSAANINASDLFSGESYSLNGTTYDAQDMYNAVSYLANELLQPGNVTNPTSQGNLSFAIWDVMDSNAPDSANGTAASTTAIDAYIADAFENVDQGYVGSNVDVYTPARDGVSQEFLAVTPSSVPEPSSFALFGLGIVAVLGWAAVRRRSYAPRMTA